MAEDTKTQEQFEAALEEALEPAPIEATLERVVARAIQTNQELDLERVADDALVDQDTATQARLLYIVSQLRLLQFLRMAPENFSQKAIQSKLAMSYVRHAETSQLAAAQIGRKKADELLDEAVREARKRLGELAAQKARLIGMGSE